MKLRWKISVGLAAVAVLGACGALLLSGAGNSAQQGVEETRRALRQQGFKTDLSEFNFSTSDEFRAREAALTNVLLNGDTLSVAGSAHHSRFPEVPWDFMAPVGSNAASVVWRQNPLPSQSGTANWPVLLRPALDKYAKELDAVCKAASSGPIRFNLNASAGNGMLLPGLAPFKSLTHILGWRAFLDLHDGNTTAAWTNFLALSRLVTARESEPIEISHLVHFGCATVVFNISWQVLQAGAWSDAQLARLQREWEDVDFSKGLPETAAFTRASMVATCQQERQQPLSPWGMTPKEMFSSPLRAWANLQAWRRQIQYRERGTYEDEKALLLHYRDRERELRRAAQSPTWLEVRMLPGATNFVPFQSKHGSRMQDILNLKTITLAAQMYASSPAGVPRSLLAKAAEAESRRRLIIAAIALERYRGRHGSYPKALQELVPDLLTNPPVDFMDGQPLRYRLMEDGHFVLYSIGLDCVDDGGAMPQRRRQQLPYWNPTASVVPQRTDLVWPRPASAADLQVQDEEDKQAGAAERLAAQERAAEEEKAAALRRARSLAALERLYAQKKPRRTKEPTYQGRPLSQVLRNEKASGKTKLSLDELLTVKQITAGEEPDIATFEVPISYDVVTNLGGLRLLVDADPDESDSGGGEFQECSRATNGNCLLIWNTTYDPPGKHFLQAHLLWEPDSDTHEVKGPLVPFLSTNVCQFDPFYSEFDSSGGTLYAKLSEPNGIYTIELKSPAGELVRTFKGTTSNGVIKVSWDLTDEHGKPYTNDSVNSVFHVTLPDSGRSQTQKGP